MRKYLLAAGICLFAVNLFAQNVCISTPGTSLVLSAPVGGDLKYVYYGNKLSDLRGNLSPNQPSSITNNSPPIDSMSLIIWFIPCSLMSK